MSHKPNTTVGGVDHFQLASMGTTDIKAEDVATAMIVLATVGLLTNCVTLYVLAFIFRQQTWRAWFEIMSACDILYCGVIIPVESFMLFRFEISDVASGACSLFILADLWLMYSTMLAAVGGGLYLMFRMLKPEKMTPVDVLTCCGLLDRVYSLLGLDLKSTEHGTQGYQRRFKCLGEGGVRKWCWSCSIGFLLIVSLFFAMADWYRRPSTWKVYESSATQDKQAQSRAPCVIMDESLLEHLQLAETATDLRFSVIIMVALAALFTIPVYMDPLHKVEEVKTRRLTICLRPSSSRLKDEEDEWCDEELLMDVIERQVQTAPSPLENEDDDEQLVHWVAKTLTEDRVLINSVLELYANIKHEQDLRKLLPHNSGSKFWGSWLTRKGTSETAIDTSSSLARVRSSTVDPRQAAAARQNRNTSANVDRPVPGSTADGVSNSRQDKPTPTNAGCDRSSMVDASTVASTRDQNTSAVSPTDDEDTSGNVSRLYGANNPDADACPELDTSTHKMAVEKKEKKQETAVTHLAVKEAPAAAAKSEQDGSKCAADSEKREVSGKKEKDSSPKDLALKDLKVKDLAVKDLAVKDLAVKALPVKGASAAKVDQDRNNCAGDSDKGELAPGKKEKDASQKHLAAAAAAAKFNKDRDLRRPNDRARVIDFNPTPLDRSNSAADRNPELSTSVSRKSIMKRTGSSFEIKSSGVQFGSMESKLRFPESSSTRMEHMASIESSDSRGKASRFQKRADATLSTMSFMQADASTSSYALGRGSTLDMRKVSCMQLDVQASLYYLKAPREVQLDLRREMIYQRAKSRLQKVALAVKRSAMRLAPKKSIFIGQSAVSLLDRHFDNEEVDFSELPEFVNWGVILMIIVAAASIFSSFVPVCLAFYDRPESLKRVNYSGPEALDKFLWLEVRYLQATIKPCLYLIVNSIFRYHFADTASCGLYSKYVREQRMKEERERRLSDSQHLMDILKDDTETASAMV